MSYTARELVEAIERARGQARAELEPFGGDRESNVDRAQAYALLAISIAIQLIAEKLGQLVELVDAHGDA